MSQKSRKKYFASLFLASVIALSPLSVFAVSSSYDNEGNISEDPAVTSYSNNFVICEVSANKENKYGAYDCISKENIANNELEISDIKFHDNYKDNNTTKAMGITGVVKNTTNTTEYFKLEIRYYDSENDKFLTTSNIHIAPANDTVQFVDMENASYFSSYTKSDDRYKSEITVPRKISIGLVSVDSSLIDNSLASSENTYEDYVYDSYHVTIDVTENEEIKVKEEAEAYFNEARHGIIRHIPLTFTTNTIGSRRTELTDIAVNQNFTTSESSGNIDIKIGDADTYVTGSQKYIIDYTYKLDKENELTYDEFYYNIISDSVDISNASFEVKLPKDFDISRIGFSSGYYGSTNNNVIYYVKDNTIYGFYNGILKYGSITIRVAFEDGYFANEGLPVPDLSSRAYIGLIVPIVAAILVFILWYIFGRDEKRVSPVSFYPPSGMNSLDMQFYYRGSVDHRGVVSLLTYLAGKGYLTIEASGKHDFIITKIKDYDGDDKCEEEFMKGLFKSGDKVKKSDLDDTFYKTVSKIITKHERNFKKEEIYEKNTAVPKTVSIIAVIVTVLTFVVTCFMTDNSETGGIMLVLGFIAAIYVPFFVSSVSMEKGPQKIFTLLFVGAHMLIVCSGLFIAFIDMILTDGGVATNPLYLVMLVETVVSIVIQISLIVLMPKRNQHGADMYARISGFRTFIMTAEKSRLEMLVSENPSYFYNVIPYAYVLGVSDKWMKQFEGIAMVKPDWYVSDGAFVYNDFRNFMDNTVSAATRSMVSSPASSSSSSGGFSSGGSSGGGSSGGGGGGGGSSSW